MNQRQIIESAIRTLNIESDTLKEAKANLDDNFAEIIKLILNCKNRLIITGIGKSAIIANKIVASLNSTGTPSVFMHAADAIHGDLGIVQHGDIVLCISNSGNTPEIKALLPVIKRNKNPLIGMVGDTHSYLAQQADFIINAHVKKEACPNGLAPTASTTLQMALGDAITVCLLEARGFTYEDFGKFHPGGAIGKKLFLTVNELIDTNNQPKVNPTDSLQKVIIEISAKRLGATAVIKNNTLIGVITDGDIRRVLENGLDLYHLKAEAIMNNCPKTIECTELAINALNMIQENSITQIVVLENTNFKGFVHVHDLLKEGII